MKIALVQICSELNPEKNLQKLNTYLKEARSKGAIAAFLPEVFYSLSDGTQASPFLLNEAKGDHYHNIQNLAIDNDIAILGGTCATQIGTSVINRAYNFDNKGNDLGHYDKNNLFAINLRGDNETVIDEGTVYTAGHGNKIIDFNDWKIGLSICFDLRFPELYRNYFRNGANLMTVSSAFTVPTGKAHWETLLRARAIENQTYIIASNQVGQNNEKISTWGHSMVINPWGEVVLNLEDKEGYDICDLDLSLVEKIRSRMRVEPRLDYLT